MAGVLEHVQRPAPQVGEDGWLSLAPTDNDRIATRIASVLSAVAFLLFILMFIVTMVQLRLGRERSGA